MVSFGNEQTESIGILSAPQAMSVRIRKSRNASACSRPRSWRPCGAGWWPHRGRGDRTALRRAHAGLRVPVRSRRARRRLSPDVHWWKDAALQAPTGPQHDLRTTPSQELANNSPKRKRRQRSGRKRSGSEAARGGARAWVCACLRKKITYRKRNTERDKRFLQAQQPFPKASSH